MTKIIGPLHLSPSEREADINTMIQLKRSLDLYNTKAIELNTTKYNIAKDKDLGLYKYILKEYSKTVH